MRGSIVSSSVTYQLPIFADILLIPKKNYIFISKIRRLKQNLS